MRKRKHKKSFAKLGFTFIILFLLLASTSISYSLWSEDLYIEGTIETGNWNSCIKIRKTIEKGCPCNNFCHVKFYLTIEVMNNGSNPLTDVNVTDSIGEKATPLSGTIVASKGTVSWAGKDLTWAIGDLDVDELVTLSMCLWVEYGCCNYIPAEVISPAETTGSTHPVTRVTQGVPGSETVYYKVEHHFNHRAIKFEECKDGNGNKADLGEDGKVQTDTFVITVEGGVAAVRVKTKAGTNREYSNLDGIGDTVVDGNGFTITLVSITDGGGGQSDYTFTVTSDNEESTPALSHIVFDFGEICTISINEGATVTAESIWCELEATTEGINVYICRFSKYSFCEWVTVITPEYYATPWAWDCCVFCCNC